MIIEPRLGRLVPKDRSYEERYPLRALGLHSIDNLEVRLPTPSWRYQQEGNSCTGYSLAFAQTINNRFKNATPKRDRLSMFIRYDGWWSYQMACLSDGDPTNDPPADIGSYVWAAFYGANHYGMVKKGEHNVDPKDGISSYYWCKSVDEIRTALSISRVPVVGINWYQSFMEPFKLGREWWVALSGPPLGGHAICVTGASDKRQAFKWSNSWGKEYPDVWIGYNDMARLLSEDGECVVAVDKVTIT